MKNLTFLVLMPLSDGPFCLPPLCPTVHTQKKTEVSFQVVKSQTCITETLNYFTGIIISVKTRSERQLLRLKQINIQLAAKIQHLEFSCSEKVRRHFWENAICLSLARCFSLPGPCSDTALGSVFLLFSD